MITLLSSLSAQQVECAGNANILAKAFSAQAVSVERATGDNKIIRSLSGSKAGYDISGTIIVVADNRVNITRVK